MTDQHLITPPPELVLQWQTDWHHSKSSYVEIEVYIATQAARWGADQELEACREWLNYEDRGFWGCRLRAARRPKPPSLKEQALESVRRFELGQDLMGDLDTICRALEALPND
jgi:hypothetical protein